MVGGASPLGRFELFFSLSVVIAGIYASRCLLLCLARLSEKKKEKERNEGHDIERCVMTCINLD